MRIDRTHRSWAIASAVLLGLAIAVYIPYARTTEGGPRGKSWIGLAYGLAGTLTIAYAGFLGWRKKLLLMRIGSVTWWMRGHLWLGTLSLPIILFHAAFSFGGALTTALLLLLVFVVASGLFGAVLQHFAPEMMTGALPDESTYEQIERTFTELRAEAYARVASTCGPAVEVAAERAEAERLGVRVTAPKADAAIPAGADRMRDFYVNYVAPYLRSPRRGDSRLSREIRASSMFDIVQIEIDAALHEPLTDLERICNEARSLARQVRLHRWLFAWLLLHIPASIALLVLIPLHAFCALYY